MSGSLIAGRIGLPDQALQDVFGRGRLVQREFAACSPMRAFRSCAGARMTFSYWPRARLSGCARVTASRRDGSILNLWRGYARVHDRATCANSRTSYAERYCLRMRLSFTSIRHSATTKGHAQPTAAVYPSRTRVPMPSRLATCAPSEAARQAGRIGALRVIDEEARDRSPSVRDASSLVRSSWKPNAD